MGSFLSLVDSADNGNYPCDPGFKNTDPIFGAVPSSDPDDRHSGVINATNSTIIVNTILLGTAHTFAVCYVEEGGDQYARWTDSGIRLSLSEVTTIVTGGVSGIAIKTMHSTNVVHAINTLPQVQNTVVSYTGDLPSGQYLSVAAAPADHLHSGSMHAAVSTRSAVLPQNATYLQA